MFCKVLSDTTHTCSGTRIDAQLEFLNHSFDELKHKISDF